MHSNAEVDLSLIAEAYILRKWWQNQDVNHTNELAAWRESQRLAMLIGQKFGESDLYGVTSKGQWATPTLDTGADFKHLNIETMMYFC